MALWTKNGALLINDFGTALIDDFNCCCDDDECCSATNCIDSDDTITFVCGGVVEVGDTIQIGDDCYVVDERPVPCGGSPKPEPDNLCTNCDECPCECTTDNCTKLEKCDDNTQHEIACSRLPNGARVGDVIDINNECYTILDRDTPCTGLPTPGGFIKTSHFDTCQECEDAIVDCTCCKGPLEGFIITISDFKDGQFATSIPEDDCGIPTNPSGCGCTSVNGTWLVPINWTPNPFGHGSCQGSEDFDGNVDCQVQDCQSADPAGRNTPSYDFINSTMKISWNIRATGGGNCIFEVELEIGCNLHTPIGDPATINCVTFTLQASDIISPENPEANWVNCKDISGSQEGFNIVGSFNNKCFGRDTTIAWSAY